MKLRFKHAPSVINHLKRQIEIMEKYYVLRNVDNRHFDYERLELTVVQDRESAYLTIRCTDAGWMVYQKRNIVSLALISIYDFYRIHYDNHDPDLTFSSAIQKFDDDYDTYGGRKWLDVKLPWYLTKTEFIYANYEAFTHHGIMPFLVNRIQEGKLAAIYHDHEFKLVFKSDEPDGSYTDVDKASYTMAMCHIGKYDTDLLLNACRDANSEFYQMMLKRYETIGGVVNNGNSSSI